MPKGIYIRTEREYGPHLQPVAPRFWKRVKKSLIPDECWFYTGGQNGRGYGQMSVNGRPRKAHRISWELENGEIKNGLCVLHKCDNRMCVNPSHLFLGTQRENLADCRAKGRHVKGSMTPISKLTEKQVVDICHEYALGGITQHAISNKYGVVRMTIWSAINRRSWRHVK